MQSAAAAVVERPPQERCELPVLLADLAYQELEQERLIGGRDRIRVLDVHLVRGVVVLAAPTLDREPTADRRVDELVDDARRVDRHPRAVDAVRRNGYGDPTARQLFHQIELELERDLRLEVHLAPRVARLAKGVPRVPGRGLPVKLHVGDTNERVRLPSLPERVTVQHRLHVVQADVELRARNGQDLLVVGERVHADAERGHTLGRLLPVQVLAALEAVKVRVEEPEPLALGFHRTSSP